MKRVKRQFAALCLIAATALSVMIGAGMPRIQTFSTDTISRLFPVAYQITYRSSGAQSFTAPVRFISDNAIISTTSGDMIVSASDAIFVCMQNELRAQNVLRSGLLAALIVLVASFLPTVLTVTAFSRSTRKVRNGLKPRSHSIPHYPNNGSQSPTLPSAA